jgi:ABC-type antimicrobial peptide transport system permease subunit
VRKTLTGIYAVVAFSASLRMHEIAIRMALGAQRTRIASLILSSAARLAILGCTLGVLGSLAVSRIIKSLLFDVSATDPLIYLAGVLIMMITAILASALPATRAASSDPIVSLRSV